MHSLLKSYLEKNYRRNKKVKGYLNLMSFKQAAVFKTSYSLLAKFSHNRKNEWKEKYLLLAPDAFFLVADVMTKRLN